MATSYNIAKQRLKANDWPALDLRVLLLKSGQYTPNPDHDFVVTAVPALGVEYAGANYGRKVLANKTATRDDVANAVRLTADNLAYAALGAADGSDGAVDGALVFVQVTNDSDSWLVAHHVVTGTPDGTTATVAWPSDGIIRVV